MKNKAKVEGSIYNAYLVEEASSFCAHYFEPYVNTRHRKVPHNDDGGGVVEEHEENLSILHILVGYLVEKKLDIL